jgi:c-di-GMP-binding flagellar brake protein YcgR
MNTMRLALKISSFLVLLNTAVFAQVADSVTAFDIFSESLKKAMNKDFTTDTIFAFIGTVVLIILAVVFYEVYRSSKIKRNLLALAWKKFDSYAEDLNLSRSNVSILREIMEESDVQEPVTIIRSLISFEASLEKYYESKKIESMSSKKLEEIRFLRKTLGFLPLPTDMIFTSTRQFDSGERCIIQIPDSGPSIYKGISLVSRTNEKHWALVHPDVPQEIRAKTWIRVSITRPGDAEYTFKVQVLKDEEKELILTHTNNLNRAQQRNWVRIDVSVPVEVTQIDNNNSIGDIFSGKIIDMSGGGFGMALPVKLPNQSKLLLNFELPGQGNIKDLPVKVVRVAGAYGNDKTKTIHSVAFDGDVHLIQEQIIQYVFEKQRQNNLVKRV